MEFLIITRQSTPPPPEMVVPLLEASQDWVSEVRASGKVTGAWAFAGTQNGCGVLEVDSHEELDEIIGRFPFAPFSNIEVIALSDLDRSLQTAKAVAQQALAGVGAR